LAKSEPVMKTETETETWIFISWSIGLYWKSCHPCCDWLGDDRPELNRRHLVDSLINPGNFGVSHSSRNLDADVQSWTQRHCNGTI